MKKLIVTIAIIFGMGMTAFAQEAYTGTDGVAESGLFSRGTGFFSAGELGLFTSDYYDYEDEYVAYNNYPQNYVENGLFGMGGGTLFSNTRGNGLMLPTEHGATNDATAPLGSGIAVLMGLGAAYALKKRKVE